MKTNLDKDFKMNDDAEKNGIWCMLSESTGFRIRRFSARNPLVQKTIAKKYAPYAFQIQKGNLEASKKQQIETEVFVDCCLVDWKGIEIDGVETPYSSEVAYKLLKGLPDVLDTLNTFASDSANYKEEYVEVVGNS